MSEDKYNEIRRLVAMWYDGLTGPVQQAQLVRFFAEVDAVELPDDLRVEAEVFRYMGELSQQCPDTTLTAEIDAAAKAEKRRHRLWHRVTIWSAAVASAAVVVFAVGAGLKLTTSTLDTPGDAATLPAKAVAEVSQSKTVTEYAAEESVGEAVSAAKPEAKPTVTKTPVTKPVETKSEVPEGFTEITDTETIIRVMQYVNRHNSRLFSESSVAIEEARLSLRETAIEAIEIAKSTTF